MEIRVEWCFAFRLFFLTSTLSHLPPFAVDSLGRLQTQTEVCSRELLPGLTEAEGLLLWCCFPARFTHFICNSGRLGPVEHFPE